MYQKLNFKCTCVIRIHLKISEQMSNRDFSHPDRIFGIRFSSKIGSLDGLITFEYIHYQMYSSYNKANNPGGPKDKQ